MKKLKASNMGIIIEYEIYKNRVYFKASNPLVKSAFLKLMVQKNSKVDTIPNSDWVLITIADLEKPKEKMYEIKDDEVAQVESDIFSFLKDNLIKGGFEVILQA